MASLMAAAAVATTTAPGRKAQVASSKLNFGFGQRGTILLPARGMRRRARVADGRFGGSIRASNSGTADENMIPESGQPSSGGYNVDANMMLLRRRIEVMRMKETFVQTPEEWMEWEKSCYGAYRADVNILLASLQSILLGMRPGVVLFIISFLLAAAPVALLLFFSALGSQLCNLNNAVLDSLSPYHDAFPPAL